jgi:ABC-type uncharacterized transport system permease subunit
MASNDPTDTGGLFIGRRPGTAPLRYREQPVAAGATRRAIDRWLAGLLLLVEVLLCVSLWGPQPAGWLWVGSQVDYQTDSVTAGIGAAFVGMCITLFFTLMVAKRVDHAWKLVRRAAGHEQKQGALERIFAVTALIAVVAFCVWFFLVEGPRPSLSPKAPGEGP